jgi:hypothetical protein
MHLRECAVTRQGDTLSMAGCLGTSAHRPERGLGQAHERFCTELSAAERFVPISVRARASRLSLT